MEKNNAEKAARIAIETYAHSAGVSLPEAINLFRTSDSARECIGLLVLAQADKAGLRAMTATL